MNSWGPSREVEKIKKPSQLDRHLALREEAGRVQKRLAAVHDALDLISGVAAGGHPTTAQRTLIDARELIIKLADELRTQKPS